MEADKIFAGLSADPGIIGYRVRNPAPGRTGYSMNAPRKYSLMPRRPRGEKCPANLIGAAVRGRLFDEPLPPKTETGRGGIVSWPRDKRDRYQAAPRYGIPRPRRDAAVARSAAPTSGPRERLMALADSFDKLTGRVEARQTAHTAD